jgi:PST family polysaccharide transporter
MSDPEKYNHFFETGSVRRDVRRKSVRGVLTTGVGSGADLILRLTSIAVLAHLIVPEHFGLVGMVTAITAIAQQVGPLGLGAATVQRQDINHPQASNLFWINAGFGALLTLGLCASAPLLARFYDEPRLVPITLLLATSFFWAGLAVQHEALLTRQMRQGELAGIRFGATLLSLCLAIALAFAGFGFWALVWQEVARGAALTLGLWWCCRWVPALPARGTNIGPLVRFGWHLTLMQFLNAFVLNFDRVLLGRWFGAVPVGLYRQAQQLVLVPTEQLNAPIQSVAQPALSVLQNDPEKYRRFFRRIVFTIGVVTMPFAAFAAVYAEEITLLVLGDRWLGAAILLRIFAIWAFIRPVLGMAGVALLTCGQSKRLMNWSMIRNVAFVTFTVAGLSWGVTGVAIAQVSSTYVLLWPCLAYSFAKTPVSVGLFLRAIRSPVLASAFMAAALGVVRWAWPVGGMVESLLVGAVVGVIAYAAGCFASGEARRDIIDSIRHLRESFQAKRSSLANQ